MIRGLGVLCLLGSLSLSSALPPCVCARNIKPVCGSDGKTYNNECLLRCAKLSDQELVVERNGRCDDAKLLPEDCICTFDFRPVCGTDGKTYPNQCSLTCAQRSAPIEMAHQGECRSKRESVQVAELPLPSCACTFELSPVCGSDGLTYDNHCILKCARETDGELKLSHMGACEDKVKVVDSAPASCICTKIAKPVCGTDGNTYASPCNLNCAREVDESLHIDHVGPCGERVKVVESTNRPDCACTRNLRPVCASNGVTYSNACLMRCAGTHLTIVKDEPCEK